MRVRRLWLVAGLVGAACAPARPWRAALGPAPVVVQPTARVVVAFLVQTPTPAPTPSLVEVPREMALPVEPAWGGAAACPGPASAPVGSGAFIWPTAEHALSGYGYDALVHPGLDIGAGLGAAVYAVDAGAAVYAGWNNQGYGNLIILDHGNGWHTLYAHLSQLNLRCGQGVAQGAVIGLAGSTGHSTGPHLHFELRNTHGRVNPWNFLP